MPLQTHVVLRSSRRRPFIIGAVLAAQALGCGGNGVTAIDSVTTGSINAAVRFITSADGLPVTKVHVSVSPANVTQDLAFDSGSEEFRGVITTPPGAQTITATAYSGSLVLGTGTATATVAKHLTATVLIKILDNSSPGRAQDHGPIVISVAASPTSAMAGDSVNLQVVATDPDGDSISYQWSQDCVAGTFGSQTSATTTWTSNTVQTCSISVLATAKALTDTGRITMTVQPASGSLSVSAVFIPAPYVSEIDLSGGGLSCVVSRDANNASCRPSIAAGTILTASVKFDPMPADSNGDIVFSDGCGGSNTRTAIDLAAGTASFSWTAPSASGPCLLTATASRETLSDAQSVAIAIQ